MEVKWVGTPNFKKGRDGYKPIAIVSHQTAGKFPGCLNWLTNTQAKASSHYLITRQGEIYQLVKDEDTAWANGKANNPSWKLYNGKNPNLYTISIEHECYLGNGFNGGLTKAQYSATLWLHRYLINKWNIPIDRDRLIGHYQIDSVGKPNCPGKDFPWDLLLRDLKGDEQVPQWKLDIIKKARDYKLITEDHTPDDYASKWFVLAVMINMLEKYILKK